jgi:hypothetical protein
MPFGPTNTLITVMMLMVEVLRPYLDKFTFVYLDDISIYNGRKSESEKYLIGTTSFE